MYLGQCLQMQSDYADTSKVLSLPASPKQIADTESTAYRRSLPSVQIDGATLLQLFSIYP